MLAKSILTPPVPLSGTRFSTRNFSPGTPNPAAIGRKGPRVGPLEPLGDLLGASAERAAGAIDGPFALGVVVVIEDLGACEGA